jgi:pilus assembly protein Flp/PilA
MKKIQMMLHRLYRDEEGATAVEYGVLVALIIAACVVIIGVLGTKIQSAFEQINDALT